MGSLWCFPRAKGLLSTSSPPPGDEDGGCSRGSWDEGQGPPEREGNAGEGPKTGAETQLSVPSCTGQRESPSPQERRGGLGAQDPGELSFHISAAELSCVLLLVPSERATDTRPPPSLQVAGKSLASGGSCPGLEKDPSCLSRTTDSRGPFLRPRPRACCPAHLGSSAHCH